MKTVMKIDGANVCYDHVPQRKTEKIKDMSKKEFDKSFAQVLMDIKNSKTESIVLDSVGKIV